MNERNDMRYLTLSPLLRRRRAGAAFLVLASLLQGGSALAGDHRRMPVDPLPEYVQECGACHVAYPPALLPAASWRRQMEGLDKHYGSDASLEPALVARIDRWLAQNAGEGRRATEAPPDDRITRSARFERKHRDVEPAVWRLPSVKSPAQCAACHAGAERGEFDDDDLRLPAGLNARQRRAWND
jgi:hypothetical protein